MSMIEIIERQQARLEAMAGEKAGLQWDLKQAEAKFTKVGTDLLNERNLHKSLQAAYDLALAENARMSAMMDQALSERSFHESRIKTLEAEVNSLREIHRDSSPPMTMRSGEPTKIP